MQSVNTAVVRKTKRPEGGIRWPAYSLASDRYGVWLFSPKGTICRGQWGGVVTEDTVGPGEAGTPVMLLIPDGAWWAATWNRESECSIAVDICTPPELADGEWRYTDLELDPVLLSDGRTAIYDEDEFDEACKRNLISASEATHARAAADEVEQALRDLAEPFDQVGWGKLDDAIGLRLPPIKNLSHEPIS